MFKEGMGSWHPQEESGSEITTLPHVSRAQIAQESRSQGILPSQSDAWEMTCDSTLLSQPNILLTSLLPVPLNEVDPNLTYPQHLPPSACSQS